MLAEVLDAISRRLFPTKYRVGTVPVRAYGKLGFDPEYLKLGCDDVAAARDFIKWIAEGFDHCARLFGRGGFRVRPHRVVLTGDRGKYWIIGSIWPSHDRASNPEEGRVFPFTLFTVLPAPIGNVRLTDALASICTPFWVEFSRLFPLVSAAQDRSEFDRILRERSLPVPSIQSEDRHGARRESQSPLLADWLQQAMGGDLAMERLFTGLQSRLIRIGRSRDGGALAWRVPCAPTSAVDAQLAHWVTWLTVNAGFSWNEFALFMPEPDERGEIDAVISPRSVRLADFTGLLLDAEQADSSFGELLRHGAELPMGHESLVTVVLSRLPASPTLSDFARCRFPEPTTS